MAGKRSPFPRIAKRAGDGPSPLPITRLDSLKSVHVANFEEWWPNCDHVLPTLIPNDAARAFCVMSPTWKRQV
jgi:hypothetical protein